jgi:ribosomal protein S18 acetylase RimI-like enzyme
MNLSFKPALEYRVAELADLLNRSFAGYFVEINVDGVSLGQSIRSESTDLTVSRVILREGQAVGCALLGRRGWTSRLAAMGLIPEARRQGLGRRVLTQLIAEARQRQERTMVLEVIEQNTAALRLYEQAGFQRLRRLVGYHRPAVAPTGLAADRLTEVDVRVVARMVTMHGLPDLPWQIAGETLADVGPPFRGYQLGPAYTVISDPSRDQISIRTIVVEAGRQQQGWATRLLQALLATHPGKSWSASVVYPEELVAPLFEKSGFQRESLTQFQMILPLAINPNCHPAAKKITLR